MSNCKTVDPSNRTIIIKSTVGACQQHRQKNVHKIFSSYTRPPEEIIIGPKTLLVCGVNLQLHLKLLNSSGDLCEKKVKV